ncbi:MAG: hypothetical protein CBC35_09355 [Planctomycetes bacterium TMED75]|nr:hypothetical protein [Planctomycetaceae bacterium]OUU91556.1 MAG: hypothetical protein CBC35_09355 [Planctomycetes bacterium TMED75]
MFAKLLTLILCLGMMAGLLLVNRQRLYEVIGQRIRLHRETEQLERSVQEQRVRVAEATHPSEVHSLIGEDQVGWNTIGDREELMSEPLWNVPMGASQHR